MMTMLQPLISIIIPIYNVERYLRHCVESVIDQTYRNLQIILIDDGSTDRSSAICEELKEKDTRIKVIHKENGGVSSARNIGLKNAKGQFITFLDGDDWIEPTMLQSFYNEISNNRSEDSYDVVISGHFLDNASTGIVKKSTLIKDSIEMDGEKCLKYMLEAKVFMGHICSKFYRKVTINGLYFNENISVGEDLLFNESVCERSIKVKFVPLFLYHYVIHGGSVTHEALNLKYFDLLKVHDILSTRIESIYPDLIKTHNSSTLMAVCDLAARMVYINYKNVADELYITNIVRQKFSATVNLALRYKISLYLLSKKFGHFRLLYKIYLLFKQMGRKHNGY